MVGMASRPQAGDCSFTSMEETEVVDAIREEIGKLDINEQLIE